VLSANDIMEMLFPNFCTMLYYCKGWS